MAPLRSPGPRAGAVEVGGSHLAGSVVDVTGPRLVGDRPRRDLGPQPDPDAFVAALGSLARELAAPDATTWALAVPGPFDYERGIAHYADVGKFDALAGMDVRAALAHELDVEPDRVLFVNDADAFLVGSCWTGAAAGHERSAGITLGTGIGSAFAVDGRPVPEAECVLPDGRAHHLLVGGAPLEDVVSTRAIVRRYRAATGRQVAGVREVAELVRLGDADADAVVRDALGVLGATLRPYLDRFGATVLVVGGAVARAWDVVEPALRAGLESAGSGPAPTLLPEPDPDELTLLGAVLAHRG